MDDLSQLPARMQVELFRALASAVTVRNRGELFLWAQGPLQALIPHGVLVGVMLGSDAQITYLDCLHGVVLTPQQLETLRDPQNGWAAQVAQRCRELGLQTVCWPEADTQRLLGEALTQDWVSLDLGAALAQGSGAVAGGEGTFFVLLGLAEPVTVAQQWTFQVLLPQLHLALARSRRHSPTQAQESLAESAQPLELSERQLEILHWVKLGKTNHEIALILDISELTVKNHMQKLFKKLNVHNRAQAVAKVMTLLLD